VERFERTYPLRWSDADANGHVRHTVYAELGVELRMAWLAEAGLTWKWFEEQGIGPDHIVAELGDVLTGAHPGRRGDDELTLFKSLGIAVEDLAVAELCVTRARERGIGTEVEF